MNTTNNILKNNHSDGNGFDRIHPDPSLWDYVTIILRGKWIIIFCFFVVVASTVYFTFRMKPLYESTATILIGSKGQQGSFSFFDIAGTSSVKNIKNEIEILKSRALAESIAKALLEKQFVDPEKKVRIGIIQNKVDEEPQGTLAPENEITSRIQHSVSFDPIQDSDILRIVARSTDPREAALIANTVAEVYHDRNVQSSRTRSRSVHEFLQSQLQAKQESLASAEDTLQKYMEKTGVYSLDQDASKIVSQLSKLEAERDAADIELKSLATTLAIYKQELEKQEPSVARSIGEASDPYIRGLQEQIARWEVQKDVTIAQNPNVVGQEIYTAKLKEIDAQISSLRTKLNQRTNEFLRTLLPGQGSDAVAYISQAKANIAKVQIQQQALQAKQNALTSFIGQYEHEFENIPQRSMQLARLQRTRMSNEKLYLLVQEKFNEAAITEQSEFGYVDIVDAAIVPNNPVSPNLRLNLLFGGLIGLALGIAIAFLRESLDIRIRTPEDLKRHGFQMSIAIEIMDSELKKMGRKNRFSFDGREIDPHLLTLSKPLSPVAESFRRLRTHIQYAQVDKPLQSLLITSPNPAEGKSTIIANLAVVSAQAGKKILLIDSDLRKPALHNEFDLSLEPGLSEYLFGECTEAEVIRKSGVENLDVISCGKIPQNSSEVLGSQKMHQFLGELKKRYDLILLDSPPVLVVTDAPILSTLTDGVLIVAAAGLTTIGALEQTMESLNLVGAKLGGIVLNYFDFHKAYGSRYHYGYKYYDRYNVYGQIINEKKEKK